VSEIIHKFDLVTLTKDEANVWATGIEKSRKIENRLH
jgi:hypothetical protein